MLTCGTARRRLGADRSRHGGLNIRLHQAGLMDYPVLMTAIARDGGPPMFLRLAAHPVRWRVLSALAGSDRTVRSGSAGCSVAAKAWSPITLVACAAKASCAGGAPQPTGAIPTTSRSPTRCGELLAASCEALHPGLSLDLALPRATRHARGTSTRGCCSCAPATAPGRRSRRRSSRSSRRRINASALAVTPSRFTRTRSG